MEAEASAGKLGPDRRWKVVSLGLALVPSPIPGASIRRRRLEPGQSLSGRGIQQLLRRIYKSAVDFPAPTGRVEDDRASLTGGVTASTEVIAVKRHTGVHASVIVCKNTIANQNLAYAA